MSIDELTACGILAGLALGFFVYGVASLLRASDQLDRLEKETRSGKYK